MNLTTAKHPSPPSRLPRLPSFFRHRLGGEEFRRRRSAFDPSTGEDRARRRPDQARSLTNLVFETRYTEEEEEEEEEEDGEEDR